jgi:hypothetical protein
VSVKDETHHLEGAPHHNGRILQAAEFFEFLDGDVPKTISL